MEPGSEGRDARVAALWASHHVELTRLAVGMTRDSGEAEALVQDAFVALLARWSQLREQDAALSYLRRVVVNGGRGRWRKLGRERDMAARRSAHSGAAHLLASDAATTEVDTRLDLLVALRALPPRRRACVLLRHYADLSEADVARLLGISIGTVKSQTSRALQQLEQAIDQTSVR
jgi:RNA polymerase sigma-70 factor (sigma-E family)